jgi:lactate dehydrogenase-like 2-hydroxyacid dehydrogenase
MSHIVGTPNAALAGLSRFFPSEITLLSPADGQTAFDMAKAHPELSALVVMGGAHLPDGLVEALPKLKLIHCFGAGYDRIDLKAMRARGITIANCPNVNNEDVADSAVGLFIALVRDIVAGHERVVSGAWEQQGQRGGIRPSLRQLKAGIAGMGAIGQSIAKRLPGFGMSVAWWGPNPKPDLPWPRAASLLELAKETDVIFVAARADETSRNLISAEIIEAFGPRGYLVNVSRGSTVDEDALIAALKANRIAGAALDVFQEEPTPAARWKDIPNVVLNPHVAGGGRGAVEAQTRLVLENLALFFAGQPVKTPVT